MKIKGVRMGFRRGYVVFFSVRFTLIIEGGGSGNDKSLIGQILERLSTHSQ
ncbi:hypothetical protein FOPG_17544, partial [Fusarium oxysporum f. sp. conglutinans race 2 54008]